MNHNEIELTDLKPAWDELGSGDAALSDFERLAFELVEDRTRSLTRRAMLPPIVDLLFEVPSLMLLTVGFFQGGSATYHTCLAALVITLGTLVVAAIAQLTLLADIDPSSPVVELQRRLARVRALRIFEWKWVLLLSPALWGPALVVTVELTLKLLSGEGREITIFSGSFVTLNLLFGAGLSLVLWAVSSWLGRRLRHTGFMHQWLDDLAGRRLVAARDFVRRLDAFAGE